MKREVVGFGAVEREEKIELAAGLALVPPKIELPGWTVEPKIDDDNGPGALPLSPPAGAVADEKIDDPAAGAAGAGVPLAGAPAPRDPAPAGVAAAPVAVEPKIPLLVGGKLNKP